MPQPILAISANGKANGKASKAEETPEEAIRKLDMLLGAGVITRANHDQVVSKIRERAITDGGTRATG